MNAPHHASALVNRDEEHLRLLSGYHLLFAGILTVILLVFTLLPLLLGSAYFQALKLQPTPPDKLITALIIGALYTTVVALNGWSLKKQRHRISCIILSCIECLNIPFGMILGISAILVLRRESVRELFQSH